jgi:hypothetical protein
MVPKVSKEQKKIEERYIFNILRATEEKRAGSESGFRSGTRPIIQCTDPRIRIQIQNQVYVFKDPDLSLNVAEPEHCKLKKSYFINVKNGKKE